MTRWFSARGAPPPPAAASRVRARPRALLAAAALAAAASYATTAGREHPDARLLTANLAWDRGDYTTALALYLQALDGPDGDAVLEPIALQTGELYRTTEITHDGLAPQFSPDGRHVAYEAGPALDRVTRIVSTADPTRIAVELDGWGAAFEPEGTRIAYLHLPRSENLKALRGAVESAVNPADRLKRTAELNAFVDRNAMIVVRDLATGDESKVDTGALAKSSVRLAAGGLVLFTGSQGAGPVQIYVAGAERPPALLTSDDGDKVLGALNAQGTHLLFAIRPSGGDRGRGGASGATQPAARESSGGRAPTPDSPPAPPRFGLAAVADGRATMIAGTSPAFTPDGRSVVYVDREEIEFRLVTTPVDAPNEATIVRKGPYRLDAPAGSPDGSTFAFQMMGRDDWEIYVVKRDGSGETRVTREIQHDLLPQFVGGDRLLAVMGEPRHRRSYLYDLESGTRRRLFHNNTVRTIAPEYSWTLNRDRNKLLIGAERDGNTVSAERGVYLMDLERKVSRADVRARVAANLAAEQALVAKGKRIFAPIADAVTSVVSQASVSRVYSYQKALFDLDSKHISRPGNRKAADYLHASYASFGYEPEYQSFEVKTAHGGRTANVLATLKGTLNPDLVYVVSSHYDSVAAGPGADDDGSGTAALLETARILAGHPQPATIVFASVTGEESGLLGSREFVRRAVDAKMRVVGALNNDMIGWANDHRLDNTIRYANAGIRDVQHAAAMQFSSLITYDALYYKGTDAAAYFEAWGDIVGGIGSYPVLGNPHYHQPHDLLETINHQLVTEVARTTAATLMLLASSPSRIAGLKAERGADGSVALSWTPSPEAGTVGYIVAWGPADDPEAQQLRVAEAGGRLANAGPGTTVSVKAVNAKGLEGWDWARVVVP
jgi:hypothetical protein